MRNPDDTFLRPLCSRRVSAVVRIALFLLPALALSLVPGIPAALSGPAAIWASNAPDTRLLQLRALLHPAFIAAGLSYLGLRILWPLKCSLPMRAVLLLLALPILGRVYICHGMLVHWQYELPRTLYILWSMLQLALCLFLLLHAACDLVRLFCRCCHMQPAVLRSPVLHPGLLALALLLSAFGTFSALRVPPVTPKEVVLPGLPAAWDGLTVAHLADLHVSSTFPKSWLARVVQRVNEAKPDIIVITGDILDGSSKPSPDPLRPLRDLRAPLGVYACLGNHEYYADLRRWKPLFPQLGLRILENEHIVLHRKGAKLIIAGVTDMAAVRYRLPPTRIRRALAGTSPDLPLLFLAHRPGLADRVRRLSRRGATLQLSGHTHAGQIIGIDRLIKYISKGYLCGLYELGSMRLHVSPGTALSSSWPFRLGVPSSDIPLLILRSPQASSALTPGRQFRIPERQLS